MTFTQRPLTSEESTELQALNDAIAAAIRRRRDWLDVKMTETSTLQVGDDIYDVRKGCKVGVVSKLYRYHTDRDDQYDTDPYCYYEYQTGRGSFDNTSRQVGRSFGTREDAANYAEFQAARLRVGEP